MAEDFTFVPYPHSNDRPSRRIRSRRACSRCRRKKRRCNHEGRSQSTDPSSPPTTLQWMETQTSLPKQTHRADNRKSSTRLAGCVDSSEINDPSSDDSPRDKTQSNRQYLFQERQPQPHGHDPHLGSRVTRFVGDLNPEARLLDETSSPDDARNLVPGDVGLWVQPGATCSQCGSNQAESAPKKKIPSHARHQVSDIVSRDTVDSLSTIYFSNVHPIIPILNEGQYWQLLLEGTVPAALVHVVCLLAAKDPAAGRDLRFQASSSQATGYVSVREFCTQLYISISEIIGQRTSLDQLTRIRILGLLSLHQESGEDMEESSSFISQAMHCAQSLALHLPRPRDVGNELKRVFWCLWALDRLNSATNSRPCIVADIDIAVSEITPDESGSVAFDVFFKIMKMLNRVIGLYRPNNTISGWDDDFPAFEKILDELHACDLPSATILTLNIFYFATAMLAYRLKTVTSLPSPTHARLRQQLCAINVLRYLQNPARLNILHPFPIVVYATALAVSVSYQHLRYSRLPSEQEDALEDFKTGCEILQKLRKTWASADAMASLTARISLALDRLPDLDVLRMNRSSSNNQQSSRHEASGISADAQQLHQADDHLANRSLAFGMQEPGLDALELFSGMDEVSWMYLDAENPVNFVNFPFMNYDQPISW